MWRWNVASFLGREAWVLPHTYRAVLRILLTIGKIIIEAMGN